MLKLSLIDGDYVHILKLFEMLLTKETETVTKGRIMSELGFSEYMLNKVLKELESELSTCFDQKTYQIYEDKENVQFRTLYGLSLEVFMVYFLKKSHKYNIFMSIGFNKFSINDYSEKFFISPSKVYKELGQLKKALDGGGVTINKRNQLIGDEMTIRRLLMNCQPIVNSDHAKYYRHKLLAIVKSSFDKEISYNLINTLSLAINLITFRREWSTLERIDVTDLPIMNIKETLLEELKGIICEKARIPPKVAEREALILATYTELALNPINSQMLTKAVPTHAVYDFLDAFSQEFPPVTKNELSAIEEDISRIICRALHPIGPDFACYINRDITYFEELYPEFFQFLHNYIKRTKLPLYQNKEHFFFYSYMLSLIANINLKELFADIVICVDFNEDLDYIKLVKSNLGIISNVNVAITSEYTRDVDVIITDMPELYDEVNGIKLIWKVPPGSAEWKILGNTLIHLRKSKQQ